MFLWIAIKNLWRNKRRTLFTQLAIVFGVAVIVFTGAFMKGMFQGWSLMLINTQTGAFQVEHRDYRDKSRLDPLGTTLENSTALIEQIEQVPGITSAHGELRITGVVSSGTKSSTFNGKGVDRVKQNRTLTETGDFLVQGRDLGDDPHEVILGQFLAEKIEASIGDQVAIAVQTLKGSVDLMYATVVGIKEGNHFPSATYLAMDLQQAQKFLRMPDRVSQIIVNGDQADYERFLEYAGAVDTQLKQAGLPVIVRDYTELVEMFTTVKGAFMLITYAVSAILFVIVGGGIANAMFMAVRERRKEIGTLKAIGMEPSQVRVLFLVEGIVIGLLGAILGVLLGFWIIHIVNARGGIFIIPDQGMKPLIDWAIVSLSFVMAFLISMLASWLPASASAKLDPVQALTEA